MRILTLIRQVLDAQEGIHVVNNAVDRTGRKLVIDTMDEYGVEEAIRLRERGAEAEIIAIAVGPATTEDALRSALAMGADRAIHIETDLDLDPIAISSLVAQIARTEQADIILCGGQQSDSDSQALGAATAARLDWPQVTWTRALEFSGTTLSGKHDTEYGVESFEVPLPAVITTQQGLNEPRYPTLPNIMKAKRKQIRKDTLQQYDVQPKLRRRTLATHTRERLRKIYDGKDATIAATQLIDSLRNEARVI